MRLSICILLADCARPRARPARGRSIIEYLEVPSKPSDLFATSILSDPSTISARPQSAYYSRAIQGASGACVACEKVHDLKTREDRAFVPASLKDNPYIKFEEYVASLM